jgi:hypothetical protein
VIIAVGLLASVGFSTGCVELKPGSDESASPNTTGELAALPLDPAWSCLEVPPELPAESQGPRVIFSMPIVESISQMPPPTLQVRGCSLLDSDCKNPVTDSVGPTEDGIVHVSLPLEFQGFLEIRSDDTAPALFFLHETLRRDTVSAPLPLISATGLEVLAANNDAVLDFEHDGLVVIRTYDCLGQPAAGIELSSDGDGQGFMFVEGLPRVGAEVTDMSGLGGFMNVPPGFVHVTGTHSANGRTTGAESLAVRPQWLTFGDVQPIDTE